jgi:hypothetical protein
VNLDEYGCLARRMLPDGREVTVQPLTFRRARITVGPPVQQGTWDQCWDYDDMLTAVAAMLAWDGQGDPADGWVRHLPSHRRRPDGDPAKEHIRP